MQQRADPEQPRPSSTEPEEKRGPSTADLAAVGNRPTVEPRNETPTNVTPIGPRGEGRAEMPRDNTDSTGHKTSVTPMAPGSTEASDKSTPLFAPDEADRFRTDWRGVQTDFVDDPRHAVEKADQLVAGTIKRLAEVFATERGKLEEQWSRGDDISTEDLRVALQRYRSFFDRLLAA